MKDLTKEVEGLEFYLFVFIRFVNYYHDLSSEYIGKVKTHLDRILDKWDAYLQCIDNMSAAEKLIPLWRDKCTIGSALDTIQDIFD
jgi:hypothetical protein